MNPQVFGKIDAARLPAPASSTTLADMETRCTLKHTIAGWTYVKGGPLFGPSEQCPNPATRITPVQRTDHGITTRELKMAVCDTCDPWHYGANSNDPTGHSVPIGEPFEWETDPRVLRYDAQATLAAFVNAIDNMDTSGPAPTRCRRRTLKS